ncbi:hypothetical protein B566_EDAN012993 [Ephemera danica]|nr:hypothetical protein B566_EDAN012993 [Ephemera danica]
MDIEKAFDTVYHKGLIVKLYNYKLPAYIIALIISYIQKCYFRVHITNDTLSDTNHTFAGVLQGSILDPSQKVQSLHFMQLLPRHLALRILQQKLFRALNTIDAYFCKWKIRVNPAKTIRSLFLRGKNLPWLEKVKYLGVIFKQRLTWRPTFKILCLYPLICPRNGLDPTFKSILYKTCVHCSPYPAWGYAAPSHIQKLQRVQNKFIRVAYKPERAKTEVNFFTRKLAKQFTRKNNITFQGKNLPWLEEVKYLGVIFKQRLTWRPHIQNTGKKGHVALSCLYPLICPRNGLDPTLKSIVYKTCVHPILHGVMQLPLTFKNFNECKTNSLELHTNQKEAPGLKM